MKNKTGNHYRSCGHKIDNKFSRVDIPFLILPSTTENPGFYIVKQT